MNYRNKALDIFYSNTLCHVHSTHHHCLSFLTHTVPPTSQQGDFKYISQSRSTSSTENPSPPHAASVTPPEENSESDSFDATDGDGPIKPARERVNAIHEGMITPFHSGSDSEGEIECSEATARWRSVLKNAKFQLLVSFLVHAASYLHANTRAQDDIIVNASIVIAAQ